MTAHVAEYCARCAEQTRTQLPPFWARRVGAFLLLCTLGLPFFAPFLASDPVVTIVSFLALGCAVGPVGTILRARGSCVECHLDRDGFAYKRLGMRGFLLGPPRP